MSHAGPLGRRTPRSSVGWQPAPRGGTRLIAALPGPSETVAAGPPLSASGPRLGSPATNVPGQPPPPKLRFWPASTIGPEQLPPLLDARIEFCIVIEDPWFATPPDAPDKPALPGKPGVAPAPPAPPSPPLPEAPPLPAALPFTAASIRV